MGVFMENIKILYSKEDIQNRIKAMAEIINNDYKNEELIVIGVLKGSFIFMADLVRELNMPVKCDFMRVSSYQDDESTGIVRMEFDITRSVHNHNVLLIEDIVDSGRTLVYLKKHLEQQTPKSFKICSLLHKKDMGVPSKEIDYIGFTIPNKFVIGYGLDSRGLYRDLPYVGYVEEALSCQSSAV